MQSEEISNKPEQLAMVKLLIVVASVVAFVCEFGIIDEMWISPVRNYGFLSVIEIPILSALPLALGVTIHRLLGKLIEKGEAGEIHVTRIQSGLWSMLMVVYVALGQVSHLAFHGWK